MPPYSAHFRFFRIEQSRVRYGDSNKTVQGYPDGTQVDYYYDAENQIVEMKDFDGGITKFVYDGNGNKTFKEYPNYETAYYFYDECSRIIEMDEYNISGKKLYKTTYSWDAELRLRYPREPDLCAGPHGAENEIYLRQHE